MLVTVRFGKDVSHCAGTIMMVPLCLINALCRDCAKRMPFVVAKVAAQHRLGVTDLSLANVFCAALLLLLLQIDLCPSRDIFRLYSALHSFAA